MNFKSIKSHLRPYSIVQKRKTTINHAFASALAPCDAFDEERLREAMVALGQPDLDHLRCVYCGEVGETWDHLVGLVRNAELNGFGHQIGNLVPCCKACNSLKGNREWRDFVRSTTPDPARRAELERRLEEYLERFATAVDLSRSRTDHPQLWERYAQVKQEILNLMAEADGLAQHLRLQIKNPV